MSTVIKANQAGPLLRRLSTVDLADHLAEADSIIQEAKRNAARIISEAEIDTTRYVIQMRQSAQEMGYRQGYDEGRKAGYEDAYEEYRALFEQQQSGLVEMMQQSVSAIDEMKEELHIAGERDLLEFAVAVATKLTFAIGRLHREAAVANFQRALHQVGSNTDLTVRAHPDDLATLTAFAEKTLGHVRESPCVDLIADDSIAPGGCIVSADRTTIDATLETQLDEIVSLLLTDEAEPDDAVHEEERDG